MLLAAPRIDELSQDVDCRVCRPTVPAAVGAMQAENLYTLPLTLSVAIVVALIEAPVEAEIVE